MAGAVGQVDHAAHHLVGVLGIDPEIHGDLDGLVELGLGALLDQLDRLGERIGLVAVDAFAGGVHAFSVCHVRYSATAMPMELAATFDHLHGRFDRIAVQVLHLLLGDLAGTWRLVTEPTMSRPGVLEAVSDLGRLLEEERHRRRLHRR